MPRSVSRCARGGRPYLSSRHWRKTRRQLRSHVVLDLARDDAKANRVMCALRAASRAPGALGRRQRAIGVYFTLETVEERGAGHLGRLFGVTLGVEAVGSQAGAKGSLCRGQPPSIMHGHPSLPVATPPVAFRPPRAATRTQIRGAGYSYQWTRDGRSGAEPLRDGAPIDSQHFSQQHSQQCSQTSSWDGFFSSATHSNTHRSRSEPYAWRVRSPRRAWRCRSRRR